MYRFFIALLMTFSLISCGKEEILSLELAQTELNMYVTEQVTLKASVSFSGTSSVEMLWRSSDENVVTVNEFGVVTAKQAGSAVVTLTCQNLERQCDITVVNEEYLLLSHLNNDFTTSIIMWKDGETIFTSSGTYDVNPSGMSISGRDIYICGTIQLDGENGQKSLRAAYWKNNVIEILNSENNNCVANCIDVYSDATICIGGYMYLDSLNLTTKSAYWLNDKMNIIEGLSEITDLSINDSIINMCGYTTTEDGNTVAVKITDGSSTTLPGDNSIANYIDCSNGEIIVGSTTLNATSDSTYQALAIWKDGTLFTPITGMINIPKGMCMYDNKLYIVGEVYEAPDIPVKIFVYIDGQISYYQFHDAIYIPKSISVNSSNVIVALEKMEYTITGNYQIGIPTIMRNGVLEEPGEFPENTVPIATFIR